MLQLSESGHAVDIVVDGETALKKAGAAPPDVMILDFHLPGANGAQVLDNLRADPKTRALPVIMTTGMPPAEYNAAMAGRVADGYLQKPIRLPQLLQMIQQLAARKTAP